MTVMLATAIDIMWTLAWGTPFITCKLALQGLQYDGPAA